MIKFDVLTVGNAIVDIIARCDDSFITDNGIIPLKERVVDESYDPLKRLLKRLRGTASSPPPDRSVG